MSSQQSTTSIVPFNFGSANIRVVMRDGQPWFVAADVCHCLGLENVSRAVHGYQSRKDASGQPDPDNGLDDDEKGMIIVHSLGGPAAPRARGITA